MRLAWELQAQQAQRVGIAAVCNCRFSIPLKLPDTSPLLVQLTHLEMCPFPHKREVMLHLPAALTRLCRLQRFAYHGCQVGLF